MYGDWNYSSIAYCCAFAIVDQLKPTLYDEAKSIGAWDDVMKKEILTFKKNRTWDLIPFSSGISPILCSQSKEKV